MGLIARIVANIKETEYDRQRSPGAERISLYDSEKQVDPVAAGLQFTQLTRASLLRYLQWHCRLPEVKQ
jgi:ABC-type uncharacterized transport system involved in gliding motility auxiliary subunit